MIAENQPILPADSSKRKDVVRKQIKKHPNKIKDIATRAAIGITLLAGGANAACQNHAGSINSGEQLNPTPAIKETFKETPETMLFEIKPPARPEDTFQIASGQLPEITEYRAEHPEWFTPVIEFRFQERPPIPNSTDSSIRYPYVSMEGYVINKEINPDGSVMIALEIPGKYGIFAPDDINRTPTTLDKLKNDGNEGELSSAIIWLKIVDNSNLDYPLSFFASWNDSFGTTQSDKTTQQPQEVVEDIRIGDPATASGATQISSWAAAKLVENYQTKKNNLTYDDAKQQYLNIVESNASTLRRLMDDAKAGNISLKEQLEEKKYVFEVNQLMFVPYAQ